MIANAEICRLNGRKSRGPLSEKGKAIASLNATKHGLLARKPPLLLSEDLTTFQEIMQSLIYEYQPQTATEHLLVQQAGMAWLRLHRVWSAEAASVNLIILRQQQAKQYPTRCHTDEENLLELAHGKKTIFHPDVLLQEQKLVQYLLKQTENFASALPKRNPRKWENIDELIEIFKHSLQKIIKEYPGKQVPQTPEFSTQDNFLRKLRQIKETEQEANSLCWRAVQMRDCWLGYRDVTVFREKFQELVLACSQRLLEIDEILSNINKQEQSEAEAVIQGLAITEKSELLNRYERHINRNLYDALDRLQAIQQRQNAGSMGSFG